MTKPTTALKQRTIDLLNERGVELEAIADLVIFLQKDYITGLTTEEALASV